MRVPLHHLLGRTGLHDPPVVRPVLVGKLLREQVIVLFPNDPLEGQTEVLQEVLVGGDPPESLSFMKIFWGMFSTSVR